MQPDISVILTTFNRAGLLPRAITSVLAQTDANFELLIVDDASTDGTQAYLATLADPRVSVHVAPRNLGPGGARNIGLDAARADAVAFLDSDDAYLPRRLSAPLAALAADGGVVCVLSSARRFHRDVPRNAHVPDLTLTAPAFEWALTCHLIPVEATSITLRRDAARAVGGFSPRLRLSEDREFLIRLAPHGGLRLLSDLLWEKHWTDDSLSNSWAGDAAGLAALVRERPEYLSAYRRLGSYLATKILIGRLRDGRGGPLWRDYKLLREAGLVDGNPLRAMADHVAVRRYRRMHSTAAGLKSLSGPPSDWR